MLCGNCERVIDEDEQRERHTFASWSEPASIEFGCVHCLPDDTDAMLENEYWERRISEEREA
jgi:hypothetical protein